MMLEADTSFDILVMDLDLPFIHGLAVLEKLSTVRPHLPVVIHGFLAEYAGQPLLQRAAACVEKKGDIDSLMLEIYEVLKKSYPDRWALCAHSKGGRKSTKQ